MTTVSDILHYLNTIAPPSMKMDWDNVGLLCGSKSQAVTKVLVALDPFENVCQEAAAWGAQLIITHHPLIFHPLKSVTDDTETGRCIQLLCRHGISAINAHTNLDCAPDGVNDHLAQQLGLENITVIDPMGTDEDGRSWGLLRQGEVAPQSMASFLQLVKERLNCDGLRYVECSPVRKVAVGGGACGGELFDAVRSGCDTFVTADVKYNQFHDAKMLGLNLIDAGHFHTENPVVSLLAEKIAGAFPDISVKISESHGESMKYY